MKKELSLPANQKDQILKEESLSSSSLCKNEYYRFFWDLSKNQVPVYQNHPKNTPFLICRIFLNTKSCIIIAFFVLSIAIIHGTYSTIINEKSDAPFFVLKKKIYTPLKNYPFITSFFWKAWRNAKSYKCIFQPHSLLTFFAKKRNTQFLKKM